MSSIYNARADQQLKFVATSDRLKSILRLNEIASSGRRENSAEHSWHVALLAMLFREYGPDDLDMLRVLELLIVHDLVEIHSGDHWTTEENVEQIKRREKQAADRLFSPLPVDQSSYFLGLWREFEDQTTEEAKFSRAMDVLHPLILCWGFEGRGFPAVECTVELMVERNRPIVGRYPELLDLMEAVLEFALQNGTITK